MTKRANPVTTTQRLLPVAILAVALLVVLSGRAAFAQSPNDASNSQVLLLRTGRILEGRIREMSTGWLVSQPNGHIVIPFDEARFSATDLEEVYQRLRIEVENPTAGTHLRLADWCFSQKLYSEATHELREALQLDPSNETARVMLHRIELEIRRQTQSTEETSASNNVVRIGDTSSSESAPDARSLAGLSPELADDFVTRIQPLLANKCDNARCHGTAATNDFRLEHVSNRAGNFRLRVERNLAATLKYIDPDMPRGSRLLLPIDRSHAGRPVFSGRFGADQAEILRTWVLNAAAELRQAGGSRLRSVVATGEPQLISPSSDTAYPSERPEPRGNVSGSERETTTRSTGQEVIDKPPPAVETSLVSESKLTRFQKLLIEVEDAADGVDAFDPHEFNRRYAASRTE
ncbi:hypothetical protein GC176_08760 [bacterium]|nr:hypothetical protein [bacterium]